MAYPDFITDFPSLDVPFPEDVVQTAVIRSDAGLVAFFTFLNDFELPPHSHKAQWGTVVEGEIELTIGGETRTYRPGDSYSIPSGDLIRVGSHDACDIRILNDAFVSRRHCSVSYVDGQLSIVDLDSTHGTLVNGEDIGRQPHELRHGDQINVGGSLLVVRFSDAEESSP